MNYHEFIIPLNEVEDSEVLLAELTDFPFESFLEEADSIKCYIQSSTVDLEEFLSQLEGKFERKVQVVEHQDQNWNEQWESNFSPIVIDDVLTIRAPFHEVAGTKEEVVIMPKMSFGTGHHETTHLMLGFMKDQDWTGLHVLDMGSGTGVLGIYAAKKGAAKVVCIDIDEWAAPNTVDNIALNAVENVATIQGDADSIPEEKYDVILANINRNILIEDMPKYAEHMMQKGRLVLSGILLEDMGLIEEKALNLNLHRSGHQSRGGWALLDYEAN